MDAPDQFFNAMADAIVARLEHKLALTRRIYGLEEAAQYLGLSRKALQQKASRGEIQCVHMDRLLRFDILDLEAYVASTKRQRTGAA